MKKKHEDYLKDPTFQFFSALLPPPCTADEELLLAVDGVFLRTEGRIRGARKHAVRRFHGLSHLLSERLRQDWPESA